ncbi:sporulation inhibitor of replication protein SirA [Sutcliffiella deserti]|uniref:sporulation inhibitor of replication protein SirA n=1 Tax=Sutcliffiella deserti TaxID=2875501 RepID=UPI001CBDF627|nr:sporulation inhibitor of replication protein SirA [Sutcliffiella deserti]
MRQYMIYLIEEEVASHYSGNEVKLFQLFQEFEQKNHVQSIVEQQVDYITNHIPIFPLQSALGASLKKMDGYERNGHQHKIEKINSVAKLSLFKKHIKLSSTGSFEAEAIFFEVIRKQAPFYMAIDTKSGRFGWLQPIKQRKYV